MDKVCRAEGGLKWAEHLLGAGFFKSFGGRKKKS